MEMMIKVLLFLSTVAAVFGQESINVHKGMNVGMHAGLALLISFGVLASCAIGVNVVTRVCAKKLHAAD
ncbi:hypothetical protein LSH36_1234g00008 [Paralvinella palmiformis]|uniref:Uncharacterized protein n=1 Tax=Paralvinella palmiformis TaxID=53620 RepID=A0AAD9IV55_9ANNE|nr:hypothetical protein LSH36_1234g00008 [Paralvinella palmiformis]